MLNCREKDFRSNKIPHYETNKYLFYLDTMRYFNKHHEEWGELKFDERNERFLGRALTHFFWGHLCLTKKDICMMNEIIAELILLT